MLYYLGNKKEKGTKRMMFKRKNEDLLSASCGDAYTEAIGGISSVEAIKENVPAGIVGAFLGGIIGSLVIILFGVMGFVASIGGVAVAYTTLTGYEKLAKKLSVRGIIISAIVMIIIITFITRLEWTIDICMELTEYGEDISPLAVFLNMHAILVEFDCVADYIKEMVILFIFTGMGAIPTIKKKYIEKSTNESPARTMTEIAADVEK